MGIYIGTAGNDNPGDMSFYEWIYGLDGNDFFFSSYTGGVITIFEGGRGDDYLGLNWSYNTFGSFYGGDGNDRIQGGAGSQTEVLDGGSGDDYIEDGNTTSIGAAVIYGGSGRDRVLGKGGNDTIYGGEGDDGLGNITSAQFGSVASGLFGGDGNDFIDGGSGRDLVSGDNGDDLLFGGLGNDTINGGNGSDTIDGGEGNDIIDGGASTDFIFGRDGNDAIYASTGNDFAYGDGGSDFVFGDTGDDVVGGGDGNDDVRGGDGVDAVFGGQGNDYMIGGTNIGAGDGFADYFYAFSDGVITDETDFILDFEDTQFGASTNDFIALNQTMANDALIFDASGYTWIAIPTATGFHYLGATGTSASAIQNNIVYV